jgi:predicted GH43/DUF377 family glycosyl hydrolase
MEAQDMNRKYLVRQGSGPLMTAEDVPCEANAVLNPGVAEIDGEVVLLLRIENKDGISHIRAAWSHNGVDSWKYADHPILEPGVSGYPYEEWGCEDARVTKTNANQWAIAYTAYSRHGPIIALATTSDFQQADRLGTALIPANKDATLFPGKINGKFYILHRPDIGGAEDIWYASTTQHLTHWAEPGLLMERRGGPYWDSQRIGAGCPPIRTKEGWLLIYHGTKAMGSRSIYRLGVALLDLEDPTKVIARSNDWIFAPEADFEQAGLMPGVVFTCGALVRGDEIWVYYGAADTCVGLAVGRVSDLLDLVTARLPS